MDKKYTIPDFELIGILGDGGPHYLFPMVTNLEGLYIVFETAFGYIFLRASPNEMASGIIRGLRV